MEIGELWAYGTSDTPPYFLRVRVIKLEEKQVVVAFLDDDDVDVAKRRVPRRNLRVLWDDHWEFLKAARIQKADLEAESDAVTFVFDALVPFDVAYVGGRSDEVTIDQPEVLSAITGLSSSALANPYIDAYSIARACTGTNSDEILRLVEREEQDDRHRALQDAENSDYGWSYLTDEKARLERIARDAGRLTERRNAVLRTWAGQPAVDRARENDSLRVDLLRTEVVALRAIAALEAVARTQRDRRLAVGLRALLANGDE